jgi:hypothetical protein
MDELIALSEAALTRLPPGIRVPRYDRSGLAPGIVHIGVGNFHRAHQAWYLHRLFEMGESRDWAIIGAGVRAHDATQREKLAAQDNLYTLIALDPLGRSAEVVGSIIDFVEIAPENGPLIAAMADPRIRIVSLTITEGGYYRDPAPASSTPPIPTLSTTRSILTDRAPHSEPLSPHSGCVAIPGQDRSPGCAATICRAMAPSCANASSGLQGCPIPSSPTGSMPNVPFPIPWWTASCRRPARVNWNWRMTSASPTLSR